MYNPTATEAEIQGRISTFLSKKFHLTDSI